jgi:hypothetical protein
MTAHSSSVPIVRELDDDEPTIHHQNFVLLMYGYLEIENTYCASGRRKAR